MKSIDALLIKGMIVMMALLMSCDSRTQTTETLPSKSKPISAILTENNDKPIKERIDLYHELKGSAINDAKLEEEMNLYGYNLLWANKLDEALAIFKLIVSENPESANAYDSLAEVYLNMGDKENALLNYRKTLSMDADNFNAEDQIAQILDPDKKQASPQEMFYQKNTVAEYHEDLDQLERTLKQVHPNALKFISERELSDLIAEKKALINEQTTYAEFSWICSAVVASVNCSHSNVDRFWQKNQMLPMEMRFPLQTRLIDGRLYVVDPLNNADRVSVEDEVVLINGLKINEVMAKIYPHISSQGFIVTSKVHEFNMWSTGMIAYGLGFPKVYEVSIAGKPQPVKLRKAERIQDPQRDRTKADCGGDLCLEFLDIDKKVAKLTIASFNYYPWNTLDVFTKFIDESMAALIDHGTAHLMIDVRGNGGGSSESSMHLLKYLIDKPFLYFSRAEAPGKTEKNEGEKIQTPFENGYRGKLYFIMDGRGTSTTGHFMSIVKDRKLGVIVGEELGSNQFCSADRKQCRLSNSKLQYSLAINTHVSSATSLPDEVGILPDHYVSQSIKEYVAGQDAVYDYTVNLIRDQTDWTDASKHHTSYFLDIDDTWQRELFQIPLDFAPSMTLKGIEDARFPKGWREKGGEQFWSYVFAWNLERSAPVTPAEMEDNLEKYFNGLMRIEERGKDAGIAESVARIRQDREDAVMAKYTGGIKTLDGFFEKKIMTFNVKAEQHYCPEIGRTVVIFRFSPQDFDHAVWDILGEVKVPVDICEE